MSHPRPGAQYIGDGVYVSRDQLDPSMVWLEASTDEGWHEIALESRVWRDLVAFMEAAHA